MSDEYVRGDRVELTVDVTALGHTARAGSQGEVKGVHTGGHLTVVFDDGRTNFPTRDEVKPA